MFEDAPCYETVRYAIVYIIIYTKTTKGSVSIRGVHITKHNHHKERPILIGIHYLSHSISERENDILTCGDKGERDKMLGTIRLTTVYVQTIFLVSR